MFLHNLKYEILSNIRMKEFIFWLMCFPVILGIFFYLGFGKIYDNEMIFSRIPVAVVVEKEDAAFDAVVKEMEGAGEPLFSFEYLEKAEADNLLENGDTEGIITVDEKLSLTVMDSEAEQSIIKSFVEQYSSQKAMITAIAAESPEKLPAIIEKLSAEVDAIKNNTLSGGNMNPYDAYFQNLIAMVALLGTTVGVLCATRNQGNLTAIGARKAVSPRHNFTAQLASLLAAYITHLVSVIVITSFVLFVLKINLGGNIPMIYLSGAIGSFAGISIGFFIGACGRGSESLKSTLSTSLTMFSCFLSGLMVADIKPILEKNCPIINRINPASLICDMFYCLTVYDDYGRYTEKVVTIAVISAIFITGGLLLTRRRKYESL